MCVEENTSGRGAAEHRGAEHDHSSQWRGLFPSRDVLLMVTMPCPSLTPKLPVRGNIHCFYPTLTLGRFLTSSCLLFSLNLLIRGGPDVSERWRLVTLKTWQPISCDKAFPSFKMHKGSGRAISRASGWGFLLPSACRDSPGNVEKPPGVVGLFVSSKAYVFPGEMLQMLWNLT